MKSVRLYLLALGALASAATSAGQTHSQGNRYPVTTGFGSVPVQIPSSPLAVLYDQTDNPTGTGTVSQDFEAAFDPYDSESADDFVVPPGTSWSIDSVTTSGVYFNGSGPAVAVNLTFYADAAGVPGSSVCAYPLQTPSDTAGVFVFTLPAPCVLGPGTYWIVPQARMDFGVGGEWGWNLRSVQGNAAALWRNPNNGFGTGCTAFSPMQACVSGTGPDFLFSLSGTANFGVVPPSPTECLSTTTIATNSTPAPIPDLTVTTSTINVSGAGGYIWDVNLLTHIVHTFAADLDITITSPAGTVVTLTTDNGGGADNVFDGTVWDDQADPASQVPYAGNPNIVTDHVFTDLVTATPLVPEEAMGAFIGENPNGTWTLSISDDAGGDTGTLNSWSLSIATLPGAPPVSTTLTADNSTPTPIADNAVTTSIINMPSNLGTRICQARVTTAISHTFAADLDITLTSPAGTVVTLTTDNGGGNDDVFNGTTWFDKADPGSPVPYAVVPNIASDFTYANLVPAANLVPEEAMAAFNGENPSGNWILTISDDAGGDVGTLNSWSLFVKTCTCALSLPATPLRVDEHSGSGTSSDLNGVFETGETVQVEPSWFNPGATPYVMAQGANSFTGPAGPVYNFLDTTAAYGTVAPYSSSNCYDATADCYEMQITGARPIQHWDATFYEVALPIAGPTGGIPPYTKTWVLHVGESFPDVPTANTFYRYIETIFHKGVTGGCAGGNYCPATNVTRAQMAVFLLKAKFGSGYVPPACTGTVFGDVPCTGGPFDPWIEDLSGRGITGGCGSGNYCPGNPVTRAQMAVFLLKTDLTSAYTPPPCTGTVFGDVPCTGGPFDPWIEDLAGRGITGGCGNGNYCPGNPNTRGQMAVFLTKTFGLLLYGP